MKRRSFLSTLIAAPLALFIKAKPAQPARKWVTSEQYRALIASNATLFNPTADVSAAFRRGHVTEWYLR